MKKVGFLIFCLFAMCSMAGKAQDVVADSTGYIVKVGEMAPDFTVKLTDGQTIPYNKKLRNTFKKQFRSFILRGTWQIRTAVHGFADR